MERGATFFRAYMSCRCMTPKKQNPAMYGVTTKIKIHRDTRRDKDRDGGTVVLPSMGGDVAEIDESLLMAGQRLLANETLFLQPEGTVFCPRM